MHELKAPDQFSSCGAQRDHRVGPLVIAGSQTSEVVGTCTAVGTNTRWRSESTAMIDQALAAPLFQAFREWHSVREIGSHFHLSLPERASKARTTP